MTKARDLADGASALSAVSATELGYLDGVTSAVQTQIDTKLASSTAATTYQAINANVSTTELGYLDGVTSAVQTQLNQKPEFVAGKNKIINGDFNVNQRAFSTSTTNGAYTFDRFVIGIEGDGTNTASAQVFTPGTAPVSGYESTNYFRWVSSGQTSAGCVSYVRQLIEDVRTFAGQTVTLSFWAKANTGTPSVAVEFAQNFGTGGSSSVLGISPTKIAITTSWARYSATVSIPSVSGKTIGPSSRLTAVLWFSGGSSFDSRTASLGIQSNTFDIWGIQLEAGSVATPFALATGTLATELAACQRYFQALNWGPTYNTAVHSGHFWTSTKSLGTVHLKQTMRTTPTVTVSSASDITVYSANATYAVSSVGVDATTPASFDIEFITSTSGTAGYGTFNRITGTSGYIHISAEI